jgi:hypothetical protein
MGSIIGNNGGKGKKSTRSSTLSGMTPQARWAAANPQAVWAHQALRSGLNRGLVIQEPCRVCGSLEAEAHHADYDRPLHVDWLCRLHHRREHKRMKCEATK